MSYRALDVFIALLAGENGHGGSSASESVALYEDHLKRLRDDVNNPDDEEAEEDQ